MTDHKINMGMQPLKTFLARAMYDNLSENPTELRFSRGDIITVLDRNPSGLEGWWVCSIRGQLGIAPGNRLELLGLINKNKVQNNSDVYDDPTGWCLLNNNDNNQNNSKNNLVYTKKPTHFNALVENHLSMDRNLCSLYENLDPYIKYSSSIGLTDSGNFSNQSSDVSFSIHSMNDGIVDPRTNPENSYEDYEDLPPSIPEEFRDTNNSGEHRPISTNSYEHEVTQSNVHHNTDSIRQSNKELMFSSKAQDKSNAKINSISNLNLSKEDSSVNNLHFKEFQRDILHSCTNIVDKKHSTSSVELTPTSFRSVKEFTGYWLPIQGRIHDKCLNLMKALNQHDIMNSKFSIAPLFAQLNSEFIIISQLCTVMIGLSKQTSLDNGLTRKFIIYRQNMENLAEIFIRLSKGSTNVKYLNTQYQKFDRQSTDAIHSNISNNNNGVEENQTLFEQTIQELLTEVNLFYTTILANSKILFNNLMNRSPKSNQKSSSLTTEKINVFNELSTSIPSLPTHSYDYSLRFPNDKQRFLSKSHEFINTLPYSCQKTVFINLNFQKLLQLCLSSLNIIDNYLNYLTQFQNNTIKICTPCFKDSKKNNLSIQSIIEQTKLVMESCSQLIRFTKFIFNELKRSSSFTLSSVYDFDENDHVNAVAHTGLSRKLEYLTDKLCESLKALITLTKETAKFLTNEFETIPSNKIVPIPGPLLQRLSGALKSVQNSIEAIGKLIKNELLRDSYQHLSTAQIKRN